MFLNKKAYERFLFQAILMHTCENFLQTVGLFRDLPTTLLYRIVLSLKVEYYLPKDLIVQVGDIGDAMYFIFTGTVAVYTKEGKEARKHISNIFFS